MKKINVFIIILLIFYFNFAFAQREEDLKKFNSEYVYWGIKLNLINNFSMYDKENNYVLISTVYGDFLKQTKYPFFYSPGIAFDLDLHLDSKNDRSGFVTGLSVRNLNFSAVYVPQNSELDFKVKRRFSAIALAVPLYLKFNKVNIYRNQFYFTAGFYYNFYLYKLDIQSSNWNAQKYIAKLPKERTTTNSLSAHLGFNYKIFNFSVEYFLKNFINKNYQVQVEEGIIQPYQDLNFTNNFYFQVGINIPLTRWLTARNWTAEQIRRFFK